MPAELIVFARNYTIGGEKYKLINGTYWRGWVIDGASECEVAGPDDGVCNYGSREAPKSSEK